MSPEDLEDCCRIPNQEADCAQGPSPPAPLLPYASSRQHLLAELERVDVLVEAQVRRARQFQNDDQFQGLYISEPEVDALLAQPIGLPRWAAAPGVCGEADIQAALARMGASLAEREAESLRQGIVLRLVELSRRFALSAFDRFALLICLAPELDLRYERLYSYLQDDVTKKRPSVDLALNLLCPCLDAKLEARRRFAPGAPLLRFHLVSVLEDPASQRAPLLSRYLKLDDRVVAFLLEEDELDPRLEHCARLVVPRQPIEDLILPPDLRDGLARLVRSQQAHGGALTLYLQGPYGAGRRSTAEAVCRELALRLLVVDGARLLGLPGIDFPTTVRLAAREAALQNAALYWQRFDVLLAEEHQAARQVLLSELRQFGGLSFLAGEALWEPGEERAGLPFVRLELSRPDFAGRCRLWEMALDGSAPGDIDRSALANKFAFTGGQIRDAAAGARSLARRRDPHQGALSMADLYEACRLQSNQKLAALSRKIKPHFRWGDIVLPPDRLRQLREIANCVKYRSLVYDRWGFDRKLSLGKGLNVLFAGPSGTGKTMAAEILAGELALDLYKIDLSTVVSKYIGETEKNLARIFAEAATSNAILFFDEADALFGRRSEVRDSHDRYANIEINYLLQQMEEYEGIVILATNLRKNMDEAFVRRMQFAIEFPMPDEGDRLRIWQQIWPETLPLSDNVDLRAMAARFELTGGSIRNVALTAAFLAAADAPAVTMAHLLQATRRELQKMGKIIVEETFAASTQHGSHSTA